LIDFDHASDALFGKWIQEKTIVLTCDAQERLESVYLFETASDKQFTKQPGPERRFLERRLAEAD